MDEIAIPVRAILAKVKKLSCASSIDWSQLDRRYGPAPIEILSSDVAFKLAHAFADRLLQEKRVIFRKEPEAFYATVSAYCLSYDELCDLLQESYNEGVKHTLSPTTKE